MFDWRMVPGDVLAEIAALVIARYLHRTPQLPGVIALVLTEIAPDDGPGAEFDSGAESNFDSRF